jgi:hypothetical protein
MTVIDRTTDHADPPADAPVEARQPRIHPAPVPGTTSAGRACATVVLALLLAALLSADSIERVALRQPYGRQRDLALDVARPLRRLSHATGLYLPARWLADATGNAEPPVSESGAEVAVPSATVPAPTTTRVPKPGATLPPPPTTTTLPPRRVPDAAAPVRVWMGGDSLMGAISAGFGRLVGDDPRLSVVAADVHVSTGVARPDVLDWPAYLQQQLDATQPEVVILALGANDDQDMIRPDGYRAVLGTQEWVDEYARRVGLLMDVAAAGDRTVVWLGLPAERPVRLNVAKDSMNVIAQQQAALRPRVRYVDLGAVLTPDGTYRDTAVLADGAEVGVRTRDGVHLNPTGADVVAPAILAAFAAEWHLG